MKKVCIVGCGGIARVHAKNLSEEVELSFFSRRRSSAEAFSKEFGGGLVYENYEQVLAGDVDGVILCTPPDLHVEQVVAALAAIKGVMVEKPMCVSKAEVAVIAEAVRSQASVPLVVAENYYYKPSLKLIQSIIDQGLIGAVQEVEVRKCFSQISTGWKSGYGALLEGGIHFVALVSAIVGASPERVTAEFPGHRAGTAERHSLTQMYYERGARAELRYAWNSFSPTKGIFQHSRIKGEEGNLVFESNGLYVRLKARTRKKLYFPGLADMMGYGAMARDFIACLNEPGRMPLSGFSEAARDLDIVFAAYEGLEEKQG
ncbi:MAG: Gfo/Idh/MocA family protein [Candidatus Latescibacterota bacterium]